MFRKVVRKKEEGYVIFCMPKLPRGRVQAIAMFGFPGKKKPTRKFKKNLKVMTGLKGRWNGGKGRLYLHKHAEHYLRKALNLAEARGCLDEIYKIGAYNHRHQRHDPNRPLSYHAYGIAIDVNAGENRARTFRRGLAPKPFSDEWFEVWPDSMSEELVSCFEDAGWFWGGRWSRFKDPMHFQLVRP